MEDKKINWSDLDQILSEDGNSIIINHQDLIKMVNSQKLILSTPDGKRFWLGQFILQEPNLKNGFCWVDLGKDNYGEERFEVKL